MKTRPKKLRRSEMQRQSRGLVADSRAARLNPRAAKIATEIVVANWPDDPHYQGHRIQGDPNGPGREGGVVRKALRDIFRRYTRNQIEAQYGNPFAAWFAYQIACIVIKLLMKHYWPVGEQPTSIDDSPRPKADAGRTHESRRDQ